jgi:hypothetical protein
MEGIWHFLQLLFLLSLFLSEQVPQTHSKRYRFTTDLAPATAPPYRRLNRETMSQFLINALVLGRKILVFVATELRHAGYKRLLSAIDPAILNETVQRVKSALENNKLLSAHQASIISSVAITYVTV